MIDPADFPEPTISVIVIHAADFFGLRPDDIYGFCGEDRAVRVRALVIWLARTHFGLIPADIARHFGRLTVAVAEAQALIENEIENQTPFWMHARHFAAQIPPKVYAHLRD